MTANVAAGGVGGAGAQVVLSWSERALELMLRHSQHRLASPGAVAETYRVAEADLTVPLSWFAPVAENLSRLPWGYDAWSSEGAEPLNDGAVMRLLLMLREFLPANGPAPVISPTWDGGVQADWELGDLYLEVEIVSNGVTRCCFVDERGGETCDQQFELSGSEAEFRRYMAIVSDYAATL